MTLIVGNFLPFGDYLLYNPKLLNILWTFIHYPLPIICLFLETYILVTFIPRFIQILQKKHNTFN